MQPLQNIKIVDFSRLLPGPLATSILARLGATVIKVEHPKRLDYIKLMGTQVEDASILFHQLNREKDIIMVDYSSEEGKENLLEIIKDSDVLLEQFRPGVMEYWGLGYEQVREINPNIIYVSLTGYGQNGDLRKEAGHDINYLSYAGLLSLLKDEKGKPVVPGFQLADIGGGAYATVMGIQTALLKKTYTGEGSYVDVPMSQSILPLLTYPMSLYFGNLSHRDLNVLDGDTLVNYAVYKCLDEKWISVGALELKFWNRICEIVNKPEWKRQNATELLNTVFPKNEIEALFKTKTRDDWMNNYFKGEDVCIAPVLELEELEKSNYHLSAQSFENFETAGGAKLKRITLPFRFFV